MTGTFTTSRKGNTTKNVSFVSLGCDKNRVNTEQMMALCLQAGITVQEDCPGSDVVVINTCGFIDSAKSEAIDTILSAAQLKDAGEIQKILVTGCLSQRYQADILEIIDHHRLADIQTSQPIRVRNEPVGSTATIIAGMYQEHGVMPSANMAGLLAAAILADTVMFKSPTCTKRDIAMAERMARIGGVNIKELGRQLFSTAGGKSVEELVSSDFKEFHIGEQNLGVGQVTCLDSMEMLERKEEFLAVMRRLQEERHYNMVILMLTDVLLEGTQLLYVGSDEAIRNAFSAEPKDNALFLPGVMSRKKQVIPMLSALWG